MNEKDATGKRKGFFRRRSGAHRSCYMVAEELVTSNRSAHKIIFYGPIKLILCVNVTRLELKGIFTESIPT